MKISRPALVQSILRLLPDKAEYTIESLSLRAWAQSTRKPNIEDQEFVSRFRRSIFNDLQAADIKHREAGGLPTFEFFPERELRVRWGISNVDDRYRELKLVGTSLALNWIDGLDERDYEFLGALLMRRLGAQRIHVTPRGNEFGIDFLALVPAFSRSRLFVSGAQGLRIVGQAKYYSSAVPREKIQAFNDTMTNIRNNKGEMIDLIPAWFRSHRSPVLGLFVAHSGYQEGARICAGQNGYILFDTRCASEVLACTSDFNLFRKGDHFSRSLWSDLNNISKLAS